MKLLLSALLLSSCASPVQQESSAIIHESVTPAPTPVSSPLVPAPVATIAPMVMPTATPSPVPTMFEVKKTKKPKSKK